jgi:hypothetical protein
MLRAFFKNITGNYHYSLRNNPEEHSSKFFDVQLILLG